MTRSVLVVEDQRDIAKLIGRHLSDFSCNVNLVHDGLAGLAEAEANRYDLIILDLMLPGIDGLEICRRLRSRRQYTPIIMLTAKSTELDRVLGLEIGADDYLTKPFSFPELLARVKVVFRHMDALASNGKAQAPKVIDADELRIDPGKRTVTLAGRPVDLTGKEFDLLLLLAQNPGRVYTRMQLLDTLWGYGHEGYEHAVNSHINRLRAKIEPAQVDPRYVLTVWGIGYKFTEY